MAPYAGLLLASAFGRDFFAVCAKKPYYSVFCKESIKTKEKSQKSFFFKLKNPKKTKKSNKKNQKLKNP